MPSLPWNAVHFLPAALRDTCPFAGCDSVRYQCVSTYDTTPPFTTELRSTAMSACAQCQLEDNVPLPRDWSQSVAVLIRAYNEAPRIGAVLDRLTPGYPNLVVVDDGSTDGTAEAAACRGAHVIRHLINRGAGAALQTGLEYCVRAGAVAIACFDADGQHDVSDIPRMIRPVLCGEYDVTLGSRFLGRTVNLPALRRAVLHGGRVFTWLTSGLWLTDCHNGFRVFSRDAAARLRFQQDRMAYASELYDQIVRLRLRFCEIPVTVHYTPATLAKGQSSSNAVNVVFHYLFGKVRR